MTTRQIQRLQYRLHRGLNGLYHGYLASVLRELQPHDRSGEIDRALASLADPRVAKQIARAKPPNRAMVQRGLKQRGDFGCARVREQLWRLQHLPLDLSAAGQPAHR